MISPDGKRLMFVAADSDGTQRLWVRPLASASADVLRGTEGAALPFWSSDSSSVAFFAGGKLERIEVTGGPVITVADAVLGRGGSWGPEGAILFTPDITSPIYRVRASGGAPQQVTHLNAARHEFSHRWPQFLPDGKRFLFYAASNTAENNATYAASLEGGEPKLLVVNDSNAVYVPPGYLLFVRQETLMAQGFDANSLSATGDAVPLAENVVINASMRVGSFSASVNGILAYQPGSAGNSGGHLLWFDRSGKQVGETGASGGYGTLNLSPDGRKLAAVLFTRGRSDYNIWVYDLVRGIGTPLTFSTQAGEPTWSPDGTTIGFTAESHLYKKTADGTGNTAPLVVDDAEESVPSFSTDGRYVIFVRHAMGARTEIWAMPLFGERKAFPLIQNPQFDMHEPALSPDGKWLAYMSAEAGRPEVYVVPFTRGGGKWQISINGGLYPRWRRDSRELFYLSTNNKIMSAEISQQSTGLLVGKVVPLFQANPVGTIGWPYDVSPDGKRFIVSTQEGSKASEPLTLVTNWPALLKKQ